MTVPAGIIGMVVALGVVVSSVTPPAPAPVSPKEKVETVIVSTSEPATVGLRQLFKEADVVALVTVLAGDAENYSDVVYKATVNQAFKGVREHDIVYFGPYRSYSIGNEYIVALKRTSKHLAALGGTARGSAGPFSPEASYCRVMYQGYSVMDVSYTCVIPSCDWAVEVSDEQVLLPERLTTVPSVCHDGARSFVWVRKADFLAELSRLQEGK